MRENTELTENEKLVQLRRMIVVENMEEDNPSKEFKELLSSLPVEMVILQGAINAMPPRKYFFCKQNTLLEKFISGEHHLHRSKGFFSS